MLFELFTISIGALLIENFIFVKFLGICPFLGVSKKSSSALGMGLAVIFVITMASAVTWAVNTYLLVPFGLEYMQTITFILIIAALVQFVEMVLRKSVPALYQALGIYLPLITTNCAVLGVTLINVQKQYNFIYSVTYGFMAATGFMIALLLFSVVRERVDATSDVPKAFQGLPIVLISAALLSMAFMGFQGLKITL